MRKKLGLFAFIFVPTTTANYFFVDRDDIWGRVIRWLFFRPDLCICFLAVDTKAEGSTNEKVNGEVSQDPVVLDSN
jgi:hypothetical protein